MSTTTTTPATTKPNPTPKLRPCKEGDTLARADMPFGAYWEIDVDEPDERTPDRLTTNVVRLRLAVCLPIHNGNRNYLRHIYVDHTVTVLGETLRDTWGHAGKMRWNDTYAEGPTVAAALGELLQRAREAEAAIRSVAAKTESYLAARQAAYAAFPVADVDVDSKPDGDANDTDEDDDA